MNEYMHEKVRQFKCKKILQIKIPRKSSKLFYFSSPFRAMEVRPFVFTNLRLNLWKVHLQIFQTLLYILRILTGEYFLSIPLTLIDFSAVSTCKRLS